MIIVNVSSNVCSDVKILITDHFGINPMKEGKPPSERKFSNTINLVSIFIEVTLFN